MYRVERTIADGVTLVFVWHGGAYIDISHKESGQGAKEVINVWDYATDEPTIPRTRAAMRRRIDDWIKDYPKEELVHDVTRNW